MASTLVGPSRVMTNACSRLKLVPEDILLVEDDQ